MTAPERVSSRHFTPISIEAVYNRGIASLTTDDVSSQVVENRHHLLTGRHILWGMPFVLGRQGDGRNVLLLKDAPATLRLAEPTRDPFLVFLHAADFQQDEPGPDGIVRHSMGSPRLGEVVAEYVLEYADGSRHAIPIRRRFGISEFALDWGEESFECVPHAKPVAFRSTSDDFLRGRAPERTWGRSQFGSSAGGSDCAMKHWLYAAENPHADRDLVAITFEPRNGTALLFGITGCALSSSPLRWDSAKRLKLTLPEGEELGKLGEYDDLDLDLGQVIATFPARDYDDASWETGYANRPPVRSTKSVIVEYTAHPDACLYVGADRALSVPLRELAGDERREGGLCLRRVVEPTTRVTVRIVDAASGHPVAAKLHIHGADGEYFAPMNRHRFPNPHWFEDYSVDYANGGHFAAYVDGEVEVKLPHGDVFLEVTKGFEIAPIRRRYSIAADTETITVKLDRVLSWRQKGWVTADTHVHFLSPRSALLEGAGEGVNVVNLLASQWGELFTNVGDFDGATTVGSVESGGDGEYLVRVGTENRQHVLGHISLLGYEGRMILPLTTGGTDESRLGDAVETTLSAWAERCRAQNGLTILPHFPNPRAEGAAALVLGLIDGVEMTSWDDLYRGISPYSLSDWYRYLNCGFHVPAVGGSDKMSAEMPVGTVRTYALIEDAPFTYESWKAAVRGGVTFVTYGPLLDFHVNGQDAGSTVAFGRDGGTLEIDWQVSSVTVPVTQVELVVNGETREVVASDAARSDHSGRWSLKVADSGWVALRVRGGYPDKSEMIAAHSSAVMFRVGEKPIFDRLDAMTILEQIEGATAFVTSLGSRAEEKQYKKVLMSLAAAHRRLHNYMHQNGMFHNHTEVDDHHG